MSNFRQLQPDEIGPLWNWTIFFRSMSVESSKQLKKEPSISGCWALQRLKEELSIFDCWILQWMMWCIKLGKYGEDGVGAGRGGDMRNRFAESCCCQLKCVSSVFCTTKEDLDQMDGAADGLNRHDRFICRPLPMFISGDEWQRHVHSLSSRLSCSKTGFHSWPLDALYHTAHLNMFNIFNMVELGPVVHSHSFHGSTVSVSFKWNSALTSKSVGWTSVWPPLKYWCEVTRAQIFVFF